MARLVLVRHAASVTPTHGGIDDDARPLSAVGLAQAEELVPSLTALRPGRIRSSPYPRAMQTVAPTARELGLDVEPWAALREWRTGMTPQADFEAKYRAAWNKPDSSQGTGESHSALEERAVAALLQAGAEADTSGAAVVLASHGAWIARALRGLGLPVDADWWLAMPMPAVYVLELVDARVRSASGPALDR